MPMACRKAFWKEMVESADSIIVVQDTSDRIKILEGVK